MMADRSDKREGAGGKAVAQYEADAAALRAKTARLREMRLAHEAANPPPVKPAGTAKRAAPRKKGEKSKPPNQTLSDWLTIQQNQGRRS
jgi:hypothetical protein